MSLGTFADLRQWIEENEPGWFFVRLYDRDANLIDSLDFRYAKALHAVDLDAHSPLPGADGHVEVLSRFRLDPGPCTVRETGSPRSVVLKAGHDDGQCCVAIPVNRGKVALEVRCARSERFAPIHLAIPRVWWSVTNDAGNVPIDRWWDRPLTFAGEQFRATAPDCLALRLPWAGWAERVSIGWRGRSRRDRIVLRAEDVVKLPLRDLGDELSVLAADVPSCLELSVRAEGVWYGPVLVGTVPPRASPAPTTRCRPLLLHVLSAPRLMTVLSRVGRSKGARRTAVRKLRRAYYRPRASCGGDHEEFIRQGLALLAAIADGESSAHPISDRWARRARLLGASDPTVVAEWRRCLRMAAPTAARNAHHALQPWEGGRG